MENLTGIRTVYSVDWENPLFVTSEHGKFDWDQEFTCQEKINPLHELLFFYSNLFSNRNNTFQIRNIHEF